MGSWICTLRRGVTATPVDARDAAVSPAPSPQCGEALGGVGEARVVAADLQEELAGFRASRRRARRDRRARTRPGRGGPARDSAGRRAGRGWRWPRSAGPGRRASPAKTMRPSVTSAPEGDAAASSSHSSSTLRCLPSARAQSISTGCCSTESVSSTNASSSLVAAVILAEAVLAQSEQLAYCARVGIRIAQRSQQPGRIAFAARGERLGRACELGLARGGHPGPRAGQAPRPPRWSAIRRRRRRHERRGRARPRSRARPACRDGGLRRSLRHLAGDSSHGRRTRAATAALPGGRRFLACAGTSGSDSRRCYGLDCGRRCCGTSACDPLAVGAPRSAARPPLSRPDEGRPERATRDARSATPDPTRAAAALAPRPARRVRRPACGPSLRTTRLAAPLPDARFGAPFRRRRSRRVRGWRFARCTGPRSPASSPGDRGRAGRAVTGTSGTLGPVVRAARLAVGHSGFASVGEGNAAYAKTPATMGGRLLLSEKTRRRPTLPGGLPPSTIGAGGLNCRVRNGNGCVPAAMVTGFKCQLSGEPRELHSEHERF